MLLLFFFLIKKNPQTSCSGGWLWKKNQHDNTSIINNKNLKEKKRQTEEGWKERDFQILTTVEAIKETSRSTKISVHRCIHHCGLVLGTTIEETSKSAKIGVQPLRSKKSTRASSLSRFEKSVIVDYIAQNDEHLLELFWMKSTSGCRSQVQNLATSCSVSSPLLTSCYHPI